MLNINGLRSFYFLPDFTDMRCGDQRILNMIKSKCGRDPFNGDAYFFMSKDRRRIKLVYFENHAYHLYAKRFEKGYKFIRIERDPAAAGGYSYSVSWKALVRILETPVISSMRLDQYWNPGMDEKKR